MVNPAQAVFSVVCFVYIFQRNNRNHWADSREHILEDITYFLSARDFADAKLALCRVHAVCIRGGIYCSFAKGKTASRRTTDKTLSTTYAAGPTLVGVANKAEANVEAAVERVVEVPKNNLSAVGVAAPRTATITTEGPRRRACPWCSICYATTPIPAPFQYVSAHVV